MYTNGLNGYNVCLVAALMLRTKDDNKKCESWRISNVLSVVLTN